MIRRYTEKNVYDALQERLLLYLKNLTIYLFPFQAARTVDFC